MLPFREPAAARGGPNRAAQALAQRLRRVWRRCLALLLVTSLLAAGDGPEELAADALTRFQKALSDKSTTALEECVRDFDAIHDKVDAKTVKKLHRAYSDLFALEVRQEVREDGSNPAEELLVVYQLAVGTVFDAPDGRELLLSALKRKHIKAWADAQALFLEGLGLRMEPENIPVLAEALESDSVVVVRVGAKGLAAFSEQPVDLRRQATAPLVKQLVVLDAAAAKERAKGKQKTAQDFLTAVEGSFRDALQVLTRQKLQRAEDWSAWFDDFGGGDGW